MPKTATAKARTRRVRAEVHALILKEKERPCARCGFDFPSVCMDFDHLPEFEKLFNIGSPSNWTSVQRVKQEIAKCEVVCSNCHRIRTWERKHNQKVRYPDGGTWPWKPATDPRPEPPARKKTKKSFKDWLTKANRWDIV